MSVFRQLRKGRKRFDEARADVLSALGRGIIFLWPNLQHSIRTPHRLLGAAKVKNASAAWLVLRRA
jgi:hypothetical protein